MTTRTEASVEGVPKEYHEVYRELHRVRPGGCIVDSFAGKGGLAFVVKAEDRSLDMPVALKVHWPGPTFDPEISRKRFLREAKILGRLNDSSIVRLFSVGEESGFLFMKLAWIDGCLLRDYGFHLTTRFGEVVSLAKQLLQAMVLIHGRGIVHRDLSPGNIMISKINGRLQLRVIDFGIAKIFNSSDIGEEPPGFADEKLTTNSGLGTPPYTSPEQCADMAGVDQRADMFSFGAIWLEVLFGKIPWTRGDLYSGNVKFRREWLHAYPERFVDLIEKCLSADPQGRFESAAEALEFLSASSSGGRTRTALLPPGYSHLPADRFVGRCFLCGTKGGTAPARQDGRYCTNEVCVRDGEKLAKLEYLVSLIPDWREQPAKAMLSQRKKRGLAAPGGEANVDSVAVPDLATRIVEPARPISYGDIGWLEKFDGLLPYERDHLSRFGLRCGNAQFLKAERVEKNLDMPSVYMLDFSSYLWTRTLKDPRSWGIVNRAIEVGVRQLALWTAGNAGVSLARIASAANRFLPEDKQLRVAALGINDSHEADVSLLVELQRANALVIPAHRPDLVYSPEMIEDLVAGSYESGDWDHARYWDVTDGWEAVGLPIYRSVICQALWHYRPTALVLPVGTGNLALSALMAIEDYEKAGFERPTLVAAVPLGDNVFERINSIIKNEALKATSLRRLRSTASGGGGEDELDSTHPIAPKIKGLYTPLLAILSKAKRDNLLKVIVVSNRSHETAAGLLLQKNKQLHVRYPSEPSALIAFAALLEFDQTSDICLDRVLVANTGTGILGRKEQEWMRRAMLSMD